MRLHLLGCAGWIPGINETSCFLVEHKGQLIMLDAGTGVSRLKDKMDLLARYDRLSIVLSHYHLDHLIGLIYLLPYIKGMKLDVYGPGRPAYPRTTREYLEDFLQQAFFSHPLMEFTDEVRCFDYSGGDFQIGDVKIAIASQIHTAPSFRLSLDDQLIYATDTHFDRHDFGNCRAKILLHECWDIHESRASQHTTLDALLKHLPQDHFEKILLIHHNPAWSQEDLDEINRLIASTNLSLASDQMVIDLEKQQ